MVAAQGLMARAALHWGRRELARAAKIAPNTIRRIEMKGSGNPRTVLAIRGALEAAGVELITGDDGKPGVRWRMNVAARIP